MARGGSKKGERRGGREPGTPNKLPKGERALVKLDAAEREVRVIKAAGKDIAARGKDRLAELDAANSMIRGPGYMRIIRKRDLAIFWPRPDRLRPCVQDGTRRHCPR